MGGIPDGGNAPELIGRAYELRVLQQRFDQTKDGVGSAVLVVGGAGIGKSALLDAAIARTTVRVLRVTAGSVGAVGPFGAVRELLAGTHAPISDRSRTSSSHAALARPVFDAAFAAEPLPGPERRSGLCRGLLTLVGDLALREPLVLVVDDLHEVDPASGEFLTLLTRHVAELPVSLLFATRPQPLGRAPMTAIAALPNCDLLELASLDMEQTATYLHAFTGIESPATARAAWQITGGNPLFLRQVIQDGLTDDGMGEVGLPGFGTSIRRRLRTVSSLAHRLAVTVAVLGEGVPLSQAASVAGIDIDLTSSAVEELVDLAILRPGVPLGVRHALIADVILSDESAAALAALRLRAARVLSDVDVEAAAEQILAVPGEARTAWSVELLRAAASRALRRAAPELAVTYLRAAAPNDITDLDDSDLHLLAEAEAASGLDAAAESARLAVMSAPPGAPAAERALHLGLALVNSVRPDLAHGVFDLGVRAGQRDDTPEAVEWVRMLYAGRALTGDMRPPVAELGDLDVLERRARESLAGSGERMLLAHGALTRAVRGEQADDVLRFARAACTVPARLGEPFEVGAVTIGAVSLLVCGAHDAAVASLDPLVQTAEDYGGWGTRASALHVRAHAHLRWGNLSAARADALAALDSAREGWTAALPSVHAALALTEVELGNFDAAEQALKVPGGVERWGNDLTWADLLEARAAVALATGRPDAALAHARAAGEHLARMEADHDGVVPWRRLAVEAALTIGDVRTAGAIAEQACATAQGFGAAYLVAEASRLVGIVRAGDAGIELLDEAAHALAELPAVVAYARTLLDLGRLQLKHGKRQAAREPLRLAVSIAHGAGARPLEARGRALLLHCGARPRRSALTGPSSLTARELQIAELAAAGMTNRAIADQLFISPKTIETHLGRVFAKLSVGSRSDLPGALGNSEPEK